MHKNAISIYAVTVHHHRSDTAEREQILLSLTVDIHWMIFIHYPSLAPAPAESLQIVQRHLMEKELFFY